MGGRRQKFKKLKPGLYIIGEGLTELYYFKHLKEIFHYTCTIKPRFCDNTCVKQMDDTIAQLVAENVKVICVFDADTSSRNPEEDQVLQELKLKYKANRNVLLCDSMPSIEYWFLIHFIETRASLPTSKDAIRLLKKHIRDYSKTKKFLEKKQWVETMSLKSGSIKNARKWAALAPKESISYSKINKAIDLLENNTNPHG